MGFLGDVQCRPCDKKNPEKLLQKLKIVHIRLPPEPMYFYKGKFTRNNLFQGSISRGPTLGLVVIARAASQFISLVKLNEKLIMHLQRKLSGKLLWLSNETFLKKIESYSALQGKILGSCSDYPRVGPLEREP